MAISDRLLEWAACAVAAVHPRAEALAEAALLLEAVHPLVCSAQPERERNTP